MAYLQVTKDLIRHRKTRKAAKLLSVPPVHLLGHLVVLWDWCDTHTPDGNLARCDEEDLAEAAEWVGEAEVFVTALVEAKFLDRTPEGVLSIHDWNDHQATEFRRKQWRERKGRQRTVVQPETGTGHSTMPHVTGTVTHCPVASRDSDNASDIDGAITRNSACDSDQTRPEVPDREKTVQPETGATTVKEANVPVTVTLCPEKPPSLSLSLSLSEEKPPLPPAGGASDEPTQTKRPRKAKQAHPWLLNLVAIYREHRVPIGVRWDTRGEAWLKTSEADTAKLGQVEQAIRRLLKATSKAEHRFIGLGAVLEGEKWLPYLAAEPKPVGQAFILPGFAPGQVPY